AHRPLRLSTRSSSSTLSSICCFTACFFSPTTLQRRRPPPFLTAESHVPNACSLVEMVVVGGTDRGCCAWCDADIEQTQSTAASSARRRTCIAGGSGLRP